MFGFFSVFVFVLQVLYFLRAHICEAGIAADSPQKQSRLQNTVKKSGGTELLFYRCFAGFALRTMSGKPEAFQI
ncbi:MAG: hypothetical protein L3J74_03505 [Bacteroidales bacterium]|nr:hypothetical protein [Bacteroidales bacterium]